MLDNTPDLWRSALPRRGATDNKYDRGYAVILAAPRLTGATRLAASTADRLGTGLVGVVARGETGWSLRASLPPDILVLDDIPAKASALLAGPGGIDAAQRERVLADARPRVLDADMLDETLDFGALDARCVLTPHAGEFARLFPDIAPDADGAVKAAERCGAMIVLKGPRTDVAAPDGRVAHLDAPNADLAKAGTGDVLAGAIVALLAQGMPAFAASCAGVWLHSQAAKAAGTLLSASDLPHQIRRARLAL